MDEQTEAEAISQCDAISALRHKYEPDGWLSTLVWNTRNNYLSWPEGEIEARAVRMIVEGFLAELQHRTEMGQALFDALVHCWNGNCELPHLQDETKNALAAWKKEVPQL